jgi:2-keto-4-pentenoate hydratase/2-oxohepta-3-ene-1,7-dioic acid hydratase in catechol pathway
MLWLIDRISDAIDEVSHKPMTLQPGSTVFSGNFQAHASSHYLRIGT